MQIYDFSDNITLGDYSSLWLGFRRSIV